MSRPEEPPGGSTSWPGTVPENPPAPSVDVQRRMRWLKADPRILSPAELAAASQRACIMAQERKNEQLLEHVLFTVTAGELEGVNPVLSEATLNSMLVSPTSRGPDALTDTLQQSGSLKRKADTDDAAVKKRMKNTKDDTGDFGGDWPASDSAREAEIRAVEKMAYMSFMDDLRKAYKVVRQMHPEKVMMQRTVQSGYTDAKTFFEHVSFLHHFRAESVNDDDPASGILALIEKMSPYQMTHLYGLLGKELRDLGLEPAARVTRQKKARRDVIMESDEENLVEDGNDDTLVNPTEQSEKI